MKWRTLCCFLCQNMIQLTIKECVTINLDIQRPIKTIATFIFIASNNRKAHNHRREHVEIQSIQFKPYQTSEMQCIFTLDTLFSIRKCFKTERKIGFYSNTTTQQTIQPNTETCWTKIWWGMGSYYNCFQSHPFRNTLITEQDYKL